MERLDHASAVGSQPTPLPTSAPGYAQRPNPTAGNQGTIVTADWINTVQETIIAPILAAGQVLDKADNDQLTAAIETLAANLIATHNALATASAAGHVQLANVAETRAATAADRAVSPFSMGLGQTIGPDGDYVWPAGLIAKNGFEVFAGVEAARTVTFDAPFPNECVGVWASGRMVFHSGPPSFYAPSASAEVVDETEFTLGNASGPANTIRWLALGN